MPAPTTSKEIKQFLGLVGYYRKFIPRFADIARPMTNLTKQDVPFEWTIQCQASFELLKDALITSPILKYPDPNKPYTLFTDASRHAWACVLTQEYEPKIETSEYQCGYWYRSFGQTSSSIIANASLYNLTENRNILRKKNYFS